MSAPDIRECGRVAGEIAVEIFDEFWAKRSHRYAGGTFELIGSDDADQFGQYDGDGKFWTLPMDDPYVTILRRSHDGQAFEIEIEVTARPVEPAPTAVAQEVPGQMPLPGAGAA
jgi:hypothetical protein